MSKCKRQIMLLLLLAMGMAGCQPSGPTATPTLPGESLEWYKVADDWGVGHLYRETEPKMVIVGDSTEIPLLKGQIYPMYLEGIDLDSHFAIVIYQGKKMSTGYSIIVRDVRRDGNTITVHTSFRSPGPDSVVGASVTSPYYVLEVIKTLELKGDFTFVLVANDQELMRQTHSIP